MSYAGDDTGAVVGDIGSSAFRFGTAGTPIPDFSCPSVVGRAVTSSSSSSSSSTTTSSTSSTSSTSTTQQPPPRIGEVALSTHYDTLQLHNPFVQGHLSKWSEVEDLWHHAFSKQALGLDSKETPVVFVAPSDLDDRNSAQYIETMFETFQIPSGYMLRKGVASSFAAGKTTSLVIDSGPQGTLATSVCEGFVLRKSCTRTAMGGNMLDQQVLEYIESQMPANLPVRPRFHFSKTRNSFGEYTSTTVPLEVHGSVLNYHRLAIARDLKETHCRVPHTAYNEVAAKSMPSAVYELPDGTKINVGTCRYLIPEMLMRTKKHSSVQCIPDIVLECLSKTPVDIRREIAAAIVLAGGSTCFDGFSQRLNIELSNKLSSVVKIRQVLPSKLERQFSGFCGGSILASLGSFQQLWISKKQYDERGAMAVAKLL